MWMAGNDVMCVRVLREAVVYWCHKSEEEEEVEEENSVLPSLDGLRAVP